MVEGSLNLGKVEQGKTARGVLTIKNSGESILKIKEVTPSCGCTVASISTKDISAGKSAELKIEINTEGKVGEVTKTVTLSSNDPQTPEKVVEIILAVDAGKHPAFKAGKALFKGKCASCHVGRSAGYIGYALYAEVCAMCHGQEGEGTGSAPGIDGSDYLSLHNDEYLRKWISQGKNGTSMPGFAKEHDGPLTSDQIDSLVKVIRDWQ
ncbi:MAG: DUF1573 domain-containing protein [bacterium]